MEFCQECLKLIDNNLSLSDKFTLNIIAKNGTCNKEDIVSLVKVLAKKNKEDVTTSKSGINSILNKLDGALLIEVNSIGRQKLYSINKNGEKILKGVKDDAYGKC